ncbi:hypothetical protein F53441_820 [Fusarium austroafricanum]|uniref:Zn(2)-C6 fungal-type domain-containing protein n=1 Tax=Fusarium austroafricanum TaxID=2364996 RepID=A0A8H4KW23_9HYPO|nr:hypothetical protein F53441_820 [Fusarium austroafricanum]
MATDKTTQNAQSTAVNRDESSSENDSKQMTKNSNSQPDHSGAESQEGPNQSQTQQPVQEAGQETGKKSSAPRVKLDMDLDVEVELKAKIKGDLELAILVSSLSAQETYPNWSSVLRGSAVSTQHLRVISLDASNYAAPPSPISIDSCLLPKMKLNYSGAPIMSAYRASRLPVSCRPCREKKRRCDRNQPCSNCTQRRLTCVYDNATRSNYSAESNATLPVSETSSSGAPRDPGAPTTSSLSLAEQMNINKDLLWRITRLENSVFPNGIGPSPAAQPSGGSSSCSTPFSSHTSNKLPTLYYPSSTQLNDLVSKLPPLEQANTLFDHFVATIHPTFGVLHIPSTKVLMHGTYAIANGGKETPKIENVLLLFSIFAGAALAWTDDLLHKLEASKENATLAFECYIENALSIAEDNRTPLSPSVTAISAISTLSHVAINSDDVLPTRVMHLRNRCYLMCREMMIHRLDSPSAQKEREVTGSNAIELEVQRRIWWSMAASDWLMSFSGTSQDGVYTFIPRLMNVLKPRNVDDDILTASGPTPSELPLSVPTDMTMFLLRVRMAEIAREIVDTIPPIADDTTETNYDVILGLDKKLQDLVNDLPTFCKLDAKSTEESREIFQSAYKILELRRMMDDADAKIKFRPERHWAVFLHVTSAALTLAVDLSHNPEVPNAQALKEKVSAAYETLNASRKNAKSLIKGIEKNIEHVMGTLPKQRQANASSTSPATASIANPESSVLDNASTGMDDMPMGTPEDSNWDEYSYQLWSDFLAAVPDLEGFEWTSLLQDVDFDPNNFS